MNNVPTFIGTIYVGSRVRYSGELIPLEHGEATVQNYVDKVGQCFTVTRTNFIYKDGSEPGLIVGLINYPRFPKAFHVLESQLLDLAAALKSVMRQERVSVVMPERTVMLGKYANE